MSTKAREQRLDEMHARIDALEARARTGGADVQRSMKGHLDALRGQESSIRSGSRLARGPGETASGERVHPTDDKYLALEERLGAAERELASQLAAISSREGHAK